MEVREFVLTIGDPVRVAINAELELLSTTGQARYIVGVAQSTALVAGYFLTSVSSYDGENGTIEVELARESGSQGAFEIQHEDETCRHQ